VTDADSGYVEGDINQLDGSEDYDDEGNDDEDYDDDEGNGDAGNFAHEQVTDASISTAVLQHIATSLADEPGAVSVTTEARGQRVTLSLNVAQQDMGRVIGRRGRTAQAIRALVAAAGAREGLTTSVDIVD
jgi:predicted RNA-binding protein YlqC (UPF0109 family)